MNRVQFQNEFADESKIRGWIKISGGWMIPSSDKDDNVVAFEVQKSSYGDQFYVGLKVFRDLKSLAVINPCFDLRKTPTNLYRRVPREFDEALDLSKSMDDSHRRHEIEKMIGFIAEFADRAKTNKGLLELGDSGMLFVPSETMDELRSSIRRV
jgi:hypothetical protein